MNAGPGGFAHAPVSKGLVLGAVGASVIANAARASHRRLPMPLVLLSQSLAFRTPGELLFGCALLYYFRVLERQAGSHKYGTYAALVTGLSYALQLGLSRLLHIDAPLAAGPLPLVFASFVPFLFQIPPTSHFTVLGCKMTDKAFIYLAGLQLALSSGRKSLLLLAASGLAGALYRLNVGHMQRWRLPAPVVRLISRLLGPLLSEPRPSIILVGSAPAGPAGAGAGARHAGGAFGEGFIDRPAAAAGGAAHGAAPAARLVPAAGRGTRPAVAGAAAARPAVEASPEALDALLSMGFTRERAVQALQQSGNDVQTAIQLLLG